MQVCPPDDMTSFVICSVSISASVYFSFASSIIAIIYVAHSISWEEEHEDNNTNKKKQSMMAWATTTINTERGGATATSNNRGKEDANTTSNEQLKCGHPDNIASFVPFSVYGE